MYVTVFSILVKNDTRHFATVYLLTEEGRSILQLLFDGYKDHSITLNCGIMIRDCIKQRCLHEYFLDHSELLEPLFTEYSHSPTFEIASDAFSTIHDLLRSNKQLVSKKMNANGPLYGKVFGWYSSLINSSEYVTRRMALQVWVIEELEFSY